MGGGVGAVVEGIGAAVAGTGAGVATSTYMSTCDRPKRTGIGSVTDVQHVQEKRAGPGCGEAGPTREGFSEVSKNQSMGLRKEDQTNSFPLLLAPPPLTLGGMK